MEKLPVRRLDATSLRALAHPLRIDLLERLRRHGPATATRLAQEMGETSGATSYHLRQLARHGFVEEDEERGTRRERWWRPVATGISIHGFRFKQEAETRDAADFLMREIAQRRFRRVEQWYARSDEWSEQWRDASEDSDYRIRVTYEQFKELTAEMEKLVTRYEPALGTETRPDTSVVEVQFAAFPDPQQKDVEQKDVEQKDVE
jgi:DNA-binding transcriptional ArsR family regulator